MPYLQKKTWYTDFMAPNPERSRLKKRFRLPLGPEILSREQAVAAEDALKAKLRAPEVRPAPPPTIVVVTPPRGPSLPRAAFSGFAREWLDRHVKPKRKPSVDRRYESILRVHLVPFFGDVQLTAITPFLVDEYIAKARLRLHPDTGRRVAPKTVNEEIGVLSSLLATAKRWGYLHENPCAQVERLAVPPQTFGFYTAEQTTTWLETCAALEPDWVDFFLTGFRTGLRLGELLALEWADLDLHSGQVHVVRGITRGEVAPPKNGRDRYVDLSPQLQAALLARRRRAPRDRLVFPHLDGDYLTRDVVKHPWERVTEASALPRLRIHDMRHTFASQLVIAGKALIVVRDLLGHSTIQQTERYAHLAPRAGRSAVAVLDAPEWNLAMAAKTELLPADGRTADTVQRQAKSKAGVETAKDKGGGGGSRTRRGGGKSDRLSWTSGIPPGSCWRTRVRIRELSPPPDLVRPRPAVLRGYRLPPSHPSPALWSSHAQL